MGEYNTGVQRRRRRRQHTPKLQACFNLTFRFNRVLSYGIERFFFSFLVQQYCGCHGNTCYLKFNIFQIRCRTLFKRVYFDTNCKECRYRQQSSVMYVLYAPNSLKCPANAPYQLYKQICNFHTSICTFDTFRPFSSSRACPWHTHTCTWEATLTFTATRARARALAQPVGFVDEIAAGYYFELS